LGFKTGLNSELSEDENRKEIFDLLEKEKLVLI